MYLCTKFQGAPSKNLNFKMRGWKKKHYFKHNQQIHGMCWIHAGSKEGIEKHPASPASRTWPSKGALNTETKSF